MATTVQTDQVTADERSVEADQAPVESRAEDIVAKDTGVVKPTVNGGPEILVGGEQGPEVSEDERQRRAAILATQLREIDEEDMRRAEEERRKKSEDSPQGPQKERSRIGNLYTRWGLSIQTYDDYFNVRGGGASASNPRGQMNDSQLKALILTAAFEKNWHTLYLYKDRSTIDPALTARAQQMIAELQRPGQPLEGYAMRVSPIRMRAVEPWNEGRPLYSMFREAANYRDDTILGIKEGVRSRWNSGFVSTLFTDKATDAAAEKPATPSGTTITDGAPEAAAAVAAADSAAAARRAQPGAGLGGGR